LGGTEPVFEVMAVFAASCLVEFIGALADLVFKLFGLTHGLRQWFLEGSLGMEHSFLISFAEESANYLPH
jgi:hypothetical protein